WRTAPPKVESSKILSFRRWSSIRREGDAAVTDPGTVRLAYRLELFRRPRVGRRGLHAFPGTCHLPLVPLFQPLVHASSSTVPQTRASVVSISEAMDAAFCNAVRATLVGSTTPACNKSSK